MRKNFVDERRDDVTPEWIARSAKIISQLRNEVEDVYASWEGMSPKEIKDYLEKLPSWMEKQERGYAVGNFHCCMHLHAGPLHHKLNSKYKEPVDMTEEEKKDEYGYVYGGGFSSLDDEDIKFLNDNGYIVVNGPEGPECRLA